MSIRKGRMAVSRSGAVSVADMVVSFLTFSVRTGETDPAGDHGPLCATVARCD
jgi:hypothetical protein